MLIQINNIEYNFIEESTCLVPEEEELGLAYLTIPGTMCNRFKKECGYLGKIPHYDEYETADIIKGSDHDCYNADTQIVLMHWLFQKQRKYKLEYRGLDPYWLFHDSFHAENDVYGMEVTGINSRIEHERLLEGAEFAKSKGVFIKPETAAKLIENWKNRWKFHERENFAVLKASEFIPFFQDSMDAEQFEIYLEYQTFKFT